MGTDGKWTKKWTAVIYSREARGSTCPSRPRLGELPPEVMWRAERDKQGS